MLLEYKTKTMNINKPDSLALTSFHFICWRNSVSSHFFGFS